MSEGFAAIPNWIVRKPDVSIYAVAVYVALASHTGPGGIHPSLPTLAREAHCSERQVRRAVAELQTLGVVERVRRKDDRGRAANGYLLHPQGPLSDDEELEDAPQPVKDSQAATGEVAAYQSGGYGLQEQVVPLIEEEPIKKPASEYFDEFWSLYPRHTAKAAARTKFLALAKKTNPQLLVDGARRYSADPNLPEKQYIPYPTTWLNQGRWEDEPLPERGDRDSRPRDVEPGEEWLHR